MKKLTLITFAAFRFAAATVPLAAVTISSYSSEKPKEERSYFQEESSDSFVSDFSRYRADWWCPNCPTISHDDFEKCPFCDTPKPKKR